jgi:hypothetical protein
MTDKPQNEPEPQARPPKSSAVVQDLKATEDSIRTDAQRLADLESNKADLHPDDPRVEQLSVYALELAQRIEQQTRAELQLSRDIG